MATNITEDMEDYKEKYENAVNELRNLRNRLMELNVINADGIINANLERIFPELRESEDEKIRKELIQFVKDYPNLPNGKYCRTDFFNWLEKQGEQKQNPCEDCDHAMLNCGNFPCEEKKGYNSEQEPADKFEPKFNVGDWLVCCNYEPEQIIGIRNDMYEMSNGDIRPIKMINKNHNIRLWTIQDAKDGDVLAAKIDKEPNDFIYIFKGHDQNGFSSYCYLDAYINKFHEGMYHNTHNVGVPATKEQRDLLFSKMKEAGYEWDAEDKVLRKIGQKPEIKDDVLSRFAFYQYDDDTIYLSSLFVRESDRGCGYGSKVLKAAEEVAKTFGISKIRLKVERNTWMEEWYKKNGYEYLSSEGKYNWLENRIIDIKPDKIEQKSAWSEEDGIEFSVLINALGELETYGGDFSKQKNWLKGLKDRVQSQPKQELSEDAATNEYVDLGLSSGTLWKSVNEEGYYTYDEALDKFGDNLPSKEQWKELKDNCKWEWKDNGYEVTGPNGNTIYLPANGYFGTKMYNVGECGHYWSGIYCDERDAYYMFLSKKDNCLFFYGRNNHCSVRLVK